MCCRDDLVSGRRTNLGHEREGAGGAQVALDHLDLIVATQKLNVERSADLQALGDQHRDAFDAFDRLNVELLRGQHEGGVALEVTWRGGDVKRDVETLK